MSCRNFPGLLRFWRVSPATQTITLKRCGCLSDPECCLVAARPIVQHAPAAKWQPNARDRAKEHKGVISRGHEKFNQILNPRKITSLEPTQSGLFKMPRSGILKTSQRPRNIGNVLPLTSSGKRSRVRTLEQENIRTLTRASLPIARETLRIGAQRRP